MKADIHPTWNNDTKVSCACGNTFTTGSTLAQIKLDICSACHPFFTGKQKFVDTQGQVERFQNRQTQSAQLREQKKTIIEARAQKAQAQKSDKPSLRDMLMQAKKAQAS